MRFKKTRAQKGGIQEVLPKAGLVVSEKGNLTEILCKPKIMPLKSITLQKLEEMEVRPREGGSRAPVSADQMGRCGPPFGSRREPQAKVAEMTRVAADNRNPYGMVTEEDEDN